MNVLYPNPCYNGVYLVLCLTSQSTAMVMSVETVS